MDKQHSRVEGLSDKEFLELAKLHGKIVGYVKKTNQESPGADFLCPKYEFEGRTIIDWDDVREAGDRSY